MKNGKDNRKTKESSQVLVQNEKKANKAVAKVMRITFLLYTLVFLLNVLGVFVIEMKIMVTAYLLATVFLWVPTLLVNVMKLEEAWVKYVITVAAVCFVTVSVITLTYHVVVLYIYAVAIASLYFSRKLNIMATVLSVIGVSAGQWLAFVLNTLPDKNLPTLTSCLCLASCRERWCWWRWQLSLPCCADGLRRCCPICLERRSRKS